VRPGNRQATRRGRGRSHRRFGKPLAYLGALLALAGATVLRADTVSQTTATGKTQILQTDAIVTVESSDRLVYKHFDLKERRVVTVSLDKMSLPYHVQTSTPAGRQSIVALWKKFGFAATLTDLSGKSTKLYDAYMDFYPPGGRGSLLEAVPPRTSFTLLRADGTADDVDFEKIMSVEFNGKHLKITLRDTSTEEGQFLMPTNLPAEARFLGITDHYNPTSPDVFDFALPLKNIRSIDFEH
jgi:hypothetical protein